MKSKAFEMIRMGVPNQGNEMGHFKTNDHCCSGCWSCVETCESGARDFMFTRNPKFESLRIHDSGLFTLFSNSDSIGVRTDCSLDDIAVSHDVPCVPFMQHPSEWLRQVISWVDDSRHVCKSDVFGLVRPILCCEMSNVDVPRSLSRLL